jgi:uncharacterized protein (UPF0303 family)
LSTNWQEYEVNVLDRATETTQQRLMQQRLESGLLSHSESFYPAQPSNPLELAWEKGFAALKQFKAREKHCRVPRGHREGAFNLGTWVVNQRNRRDALSVQRRRSLKAIGFNWTALLVRDSWEEGFAALKQFQSREGHCRVHERHEEGSFKLGSWVARQRTKRQTMSTAWRRQLDAIGFVWDPYESAWERGFAALKQFKAREKHCRVPRGHREGAFNLGTWVVNQRNRKNTLAVQRRRSLDAIGFVWRLK